MLKKYQIDDDIICQSTVDSYWDDPFINWQIPFAKEKAQLKDKSYFATLIRFSQMCNNKGSITDNNEIHHPNGKNFLCFYKTQAAASQSENNEQDTNMVTKSQTEYEYAATVTVYPPDSSGSNFNYGYRNLVWDGRWGNECIELVGEIILHHWLSWIQSVFGNFVLRLNEMIMYHTLKSALGSYWLMDSINIDSKFTGKGIGLHLIQYALNTHVIPQSKKFDHNGFTVVLTGNGKNINFLTKNGYKLLSTMKITPKKNDLDEMMDNVNCYCLLWHWNEKKMC